MEPLRSPDKTVQQIDSLLQDLDRASAAAPAHKPSTPPTAQEESSRIRQFSDAGGCNRPIRERFREARGDATAADPADAPPQKGSAARFGGPRYVEGVSVTSADLDTYMLFPSPATTVARMRANMPLRPPVVQRVHKPKPKSTPAPAPQQTVVVVRPVEPLVPPPPPIFAPQYGPMDRLEEVMQCSDAVGAHCVRSRWSGTLCGISPCLAPHTLTGHTIPMGIMVVLHPGNRGAISDLV